MRALASICCLFLFGCILENPVKETPVPSETEYCEWLIEELYFFDDFQKGKTWDSPSALFSSLKDPYTRYVTPSIAPDIEETINTSIIPGEIGIELASEISAEYPLIAYRIYKDSPAYRAKVPRFARLISINGTSLKNDSLGKTYEKELQTCDSVLLTYSHNADTLEVSLPKEKVFAPTVFLDTVSNTPWITLREFRGETLDRKEGSFGELKTILKEIENFKNQIIIDLRNNPGGSLNQCASAADLFVKEGMLFSVHENVLYSNGHGKEIQRIYEVSQKTFEKDKDIFLLTNEKTASCGEVFAMALKTGNSKVKIIGKKTFGKGIAQSIWKTPAGGIVYVTNMQIFDRNGESYHGKGIIPDYTCESNFLECIQNALKISNEESAKNKILQLSNAKYKRNFYEFIQNDLFVKGKIQNP